MDNKLTSLFSFSFNLTYLLLLASFYLPLSAATTTTTATATTTTTTNPLDFIRSSCNATLYPDLCYTSLARYANAAHLDPAQLARFAIGVSLIRAHQAASLFSNMTRRADYGPNTRAVSALHDCSSTFEEAVDQIRGSLKEITNLATTTSPTTVSVRFQLSNVQTWMSSALTNEDTCTDGFADVEECPLKHEVCDKVVDVKEYTSNALALVNTFAASLNSR